MLFRKPYGIDLGSSTIKVYSSTKNKSYMTKNLIAHRGREIIAVGNEAYEMFEKTPASVQVEMPMTFGMIANAELEEISLYQMLRQIDPKSHRGGEVFFSVPMDTTAIEKNAYYRCVNGKWLRNNKVFLVEEPIADAIALGIPLEKNKGSMIVNLGAQSTSFSVIAEGKVIISRKVPIGGRQMNEAICNEIRKHYNLSIGTRTAKRLKTAIGRMHSDQPAARKIVGIDSLSGLPREEAISSEVVGEGLEDCLREIGREMKSFLERTPPQIAARIAYKGIYLTGGSSRIPDIQTYLEEATGYTYKLSGLYELSIIKGLERIIREPELRKWAAQLKPRKL